MIHHDPWCQHAYLRILSNFARDGSLGSPQIEQADVRPSPLKALGPVTVSRRSAAEGCAYAQDTPSKDGERLASTWRMRRARSFEQLLSRRASGMHGCKAAGTRAAPAEAAPPAGGSRSEADERRTIRSIAPSFFGLSFSGKSLHFVSAALPHALPGSCTWLSAKIIDWGLSGPKISSPAARQKRKVGSLRSPAGDPPLREHPRRRYTPVNTPGLQAAYDLLRCKKKSFHPGQRLSRGKSREQAGHLRAPRRHLF